MTPDAGSRSASLRFRLRFSILRILQFTLRSQLCTPHRTAAASGMVASRPIHRPTTVPTPLTASALSRFDHNGSAFCFSVPCLSSQCLCSASPSAVTSTVRLPHTLATSHAGALPILPLLCCPACMGFRSSRSRPYPLQFRSAPRPSRCSRRLALVTCSAIGSHRSASPRVRLVRSVPLRCA